METAEDIKKMVREKYAGIAIQNEKLPGACGCGCNDDIDYSIMSEDYSKIKGYAPEADLGLGCGLPTEVAFIRPGDTVVDMGSGAGNDCFIAARECGENGKGQNFPGVGIVIGPSGEVIQSYSGDDEYMIIADLKSDALNDVRSHKMKYFLPNRRPEIY